jgi:hypothetical protein
MPKLVKDMEVGEVYAGWELKQIERTGSGHAGASPYYNLTFEKDGITKALKAIEWEQTDKDIIAQLSKYRGGKRRTHKHKKTRKHKKSRKSTRRHNKRR